MIWTGGGWGREGRGGGVEKNERMRERGGEQEIHGKLGKTEEGENMRERERERERERGEHIGGAKGWRG